MGRLSSPPSALGMFHQTNAAARAVPLSDNQLGQFATGPSSDSINGQSSGRPLASLENGQAAPQGSSQSRNGTVNGDIEHVASSEPNGISFKQNVSRSRTENHKGLAYRPRAAMARAKTNYEPANLSPNGDTNVEEHGELRHGWEDEYNSSEFLGQLNSVKLLYFRQT